MEIYSFPYEAYFDIDNEPYFQGRIVVNRIPQGYHADIDIITRENQRIYKHVGHLFEKESEECFDSAVYRLQSFLKEGK
jgi:hypothetical protein